MYSPALEMVPTLGLIDHFTAVLLVPVTVAVNCWLPPASRFAADGITETPTGINVRLALPDFAGSATLVAVTVTVCWLATRFGAVYSPLVDIVPTVGLIDQVTAVLGVPKTEAENGCD